MVLFNNSNWESKGIANEMLPPLTLKIKVLNLVGLELHVLILGLTTINPCMVPVHIHTDQMSSDKGLFVLTPLEKIKYHN